MPHQQAVARVAVPDHMIHRVCLGHDQVDHRQKLVVIAVAGLGPQGNPLIGRASQARVVRREVIHAPQGHVLAGLVRPSQADKNVVTGLAGGDPILEIELSGLLSKQRDRGERSEVTRVVVVDGGRYGPTRGVVTGQKMDIVQPHRRPFDFRRPAAGRGVDRDQKVLGVGLDGRCRPCRREPQKNCGGERAHGTYVYRFAHDSIPREARVIDAMAPASASAFWKSITSCRENLGRQPDISSGCSPRLSRSSVIIAKDTVVALLS